MGTMDLLAVFKYLWAILVPIMMRMWTVVDKRFEKSENSIENMKEDYSKLSSKLDVIDERTKHQAEDITEIKELLMKLIMKEDK